MDKLEGRDRTRVSKLGGGRLAYYWAAEAGKLQDNVIISAHGGIKKGAPENLPVQSGFVLKYYVVHGVEQGDFGLGKFAAPTPPTAFESINGGAKTYNYGLSKYQGTHNEAGEDYATIEAQGARAISHNATLDELFPDGELPSNVAGPQKLFDVVTVRYRRFTPDTDLKTVLKQLWTHRGKGATVHCFFCRSYL